MQSTLIADLLITILLTKKILRAKCYYPVYIEKIIVKLRLKISLQNIGQLRV